MTMTPERLWPIEGYAPGKYACVCAKCGQRHMADKRAFHCADCTLQAQAAELTRLRAKVDAADKLAEVAKEARNNLLAAAQNIVGDVYALEYVADLDAALSAYEEAGK